MLIVCKILLVFVCLIDCIVKNLFIGNLLLRYLINKSFCFIILEFVELFVIVEKKWGFVLFSFLFKLVFKIFVDDLMKFLYVWLLK